MRHHRSRPVAAAVAAAALAVTACAAEDTDGDPVATEGTDLSDEPSLHVGLGTDVQSFDPNLLADMVSYHVLRNVAEPLLTFEDGELQPRLATSYELVDETTWEFELVEGATFHNGEPFDAEAVVYAVERITDPDLENARRSRWENITGAEAVDASTVRVTTQEPQGLLPALMSYLPIIAPEAARDGGDAHIGTTPIGTGPFVFEEWARDERIVLSRNDDYWGEPAGVEEVVFRPIPEDSTRVAELQTGGIDIAVNVPPALVGEIESSSDVGIEQVPSSRFVYLGLNIEENETLADPDVRRALNHAVDVEGIIDGLFDGEGEIMSHPTTSQHFGFGPDISPYEYDPELAEQMLADAGASDLTLTFNAPRGRYLLDSEVAQLVAGQLEQVGVTVDLEILEWGTFSDLTASRDLGDMWLLGWGNVPGLDADQVYGPLLVTGAVNSYISDARLDDLVATASRETEPQEREATYRDAAQLMHDEAPWIYLYGQTDLYGIGAHVSGFVPGPDESLDVSRVVLGDDG